MEAIAQDDLRIEVIEGPPVAPYTVRPSRGGVIGRSEDCAFTLPDPSVSRRHVEVTPTSGGWTVTDCRSRHGTCLNSVRLEEGEAAQLASGDLLRIGDVMLTVAIGDGGKPVSPRTQETPEVPEPPRPEPPPRESADHPDSLATRPSIFLRLDGDETTQRDLSWHEFVDRYRPVIVGVARRAGMKGSDADDVLQDVLLGFFRVVGQFEYDPSRGRFRGYLKRVTHNAIRARARKARPDAGGGMELIECNEGRFDRLWNQEWTRQVLSRALAEARSSFGATTWEAFELFGQRGVPAEEVAAQVGMSASAVRHAKSRAARMIREAIDRIRAAEG